MKYVEVQEWNLSIGMELEYRNGTQDKNGMCEYKIEPVRVQDWNM